MLEYSIYHQYFNGGIIQVLSYNVTQLLNAQFLISIKNLGKTWDYCHQLGHKATCTDRGILLHIEMKNPG